MEIMFWNMVAEVFATMMGMYDRDADMARAKTVMEQAIYQTVLFCKGVRDVRMSDCTIILVDKYGMNFKNEEIIPVKLKEVAVV